MPLYILGVLSESHHHVARKTPPSLVDKWLNGSPGCMCSSPTSSVLSSEPIME